MQKWVPWLWYGLAGLGLALTVFRVAASASGTGPAMAIQQLPMGLVQMLSAAGIGATYQFVLKVRPASAIGVIAIVQAVFALIASLAQHAGFGIQARAMAESDFSSAAQSIGIAFGVASIAAFAAAALFLIAMIVAINSRAPQGDAFS